MYEKAANGREKHIDFILLDFICMHISLLLAHILRFADEFGRRIDFYVTMATIFTLSFCVVMLFYSGYKNVIRRGYYKEFVGVLQKTALVSLLSILALYLTQKSTDTSRLVFVIFCIIDILLSYTVRILHKKKLRKKDALNIGSRSLIIVCRSINAAQFLERIKEEDYGLNITGLVIADKDMRGQEIAGIPVIAYTDDAVGYICRNWVDEVFIGKGTNDIFPEFVGELKNACQKMGITIHTMLLSLANDQEAVITEKFAGFLVLSQSVAVVTHRQMMINSMR